MSPTIAIDIAIIVALLLYCIDGYRRGFLLLAIELVGTLLTLYLAFRWASPAGAWLHSIVSYPETLQKPIGFLLLWFSLQTIYVAVSTLLYPRIPELVRQSVVNKAAGVFPSVVKGLAMTAIVLTLLVILPYENRLRPAILGSRFGKPLVVKTQALQQQLIASHSQEITDTLTFITTTPFTRKIDEKNETLPLHFKTTEVTVDQNSEATMLRLVNEERAKNGLKPLLPDAELREVARDHARDMLARGYFSHDTPEGDDPFDRMDSAKIVFTTAGENLAFAPTVELAHIGLMNSPGHRANILEEDFGHLGIGVIDAGLYGKMFVQEFKN